MNLYIFDEGDSSVGLFPAKYTVECPFDEGNEPDSDELTSFKEAIVSGFREYGGVGNMYGLYDFEIKQLDEKVELRYCTVVNRSGSQFLGKVEYSEKDEAWGPTDVLLNDEWISIERFKSIAPSGFYSCKDYRVIP